MKAVKLWLPVLIWTVIIFCLSNIPNFQSGLSNDFILRKIAHFVEYFILVFLLFRAFKGSLNAGTFNSYIYSSTLSLGFAVSDEIHQLFVPGRTGCVRDVLIDAAGILSFYAFLKL